MHVIKSAASQSFIESVRTLEEQADLCYEGLELLSKNSWNVGIWASLVKAAERLESIPHTAYGGKTHLIMLINLSRIIPLMCAWCRDHSDTRTAPISKFQWTRARQLASSTAFDVAAQYFAFCATFPAWHRSLVAAELFQPNGVEFISLDDSEGRRVSAYQKGFGPASAGAATAMPSVARPYEMENLIAETLRTVKNHGMEINYPKPERLLRYLNETYQNRLAGAFRRYEGIAVGKYSLKEFRMVYAALLAIAGSHEHICFRWSTSNFYPFESAVLHYTKKSWVDLLCDLSTVPNDAVAAVVDDLTLGATKLWDLMVHPLVALDNDHRRLGLLPHFVLASNSEENILRTCSLIRPRFHNAASAEKEAEMRDELRAITSPFRFSGPIKLRGDLPDIDFIVEDCATSTVAICELKWGRKPYSVIERISRDSELMHGVRQVEMIQGFLDQDPDFLRQRGFLTKTLADYRRIQYLLVARDHLTWIPPSARKAIVGFNPFKTCLEKSDFSARLDQLLSYDWLPLEGKHFRVGLEDPVVNGVTMRSEIFYPL